LKLLPCLVLAAVAGSVPALAAEGDWSQWRGPARDGYAPVAGNERLAAALHGPLPASLHQVWKKEVGLGQSAPVIHEGKLFIHVRQGEDEVVLALDPETGDEIWRYAYPVAYVPVNHAWAWGPGPKSTLTAVGDTLYTFGVTERLHAIDADQGDVRWDRSYDDVYQQPFPECGTSASPLVEGDLVIVPIGQTWPDPSIESLGEIVAYNRHTGEEVWRTEYLPPGYASPMAFTIDGVRQIVTSTQNHVVGIRVDDGKTLWKKELRIFMEQNIPTPLLYEGNILIGGYHWGNALLDPEPTDGDGLWNVNSVWATKRHELYMDSPVLVGDHAYFRSHKRLGTLVCVDMRTGQQCWQGPPQVARYAAFVVVGGDRLLVLTDNGEIKWHYQSTPREGWDYDGVNEVVAYTDREGDRRFATADRNGFFYVLNRKDGAFVSATPFVKDITWAEGIDGNGRPIFAESNRPGNPASATDGAKGEVVFASPSFLGGKNWMPMSFSRRTGNFYVPSNEWGMDIWNEPITYKKGAAYLGAGFTIKPNYEDHIGSLKAIDPDTGEIRWEYRNDAPLWAGVMTTAGGLVFTGNPEGRFIAFDDETGDVLWSFQTGSGIVGQPVTWEMDGEQYVSVISGWGGAVPLWGGEVAKKVSYLNQGGTLWTFRLPAALAMAK